MRLPDRYPGRYRWLVLVLRRDLGAGRLGGFDLTTATVDDRKLLEPLIRWMQDGIVVGDGGYLS